MKKNIAFLLFLPLLAQSKQIIKLSNIPVLYNIDSLEEKTKKIKDKDLNYLIGILTVEWSRLQIGAGGCGKYFEEIEKYAAIYHQPIGVPFVEYAHVSSNLQYGYKINHYLLSKAENSLKQFEVNQDEYGIFFTHSLIARLFTSRVQQMQTKEERIDVGKDRKEELLKSKEHNRIADSIARKSKNPFLLGFNNLQQIKANIDIYRLEQKLAGLDSVKKMCQQAITYLNKSKAQIHYLSSVYNFYSIALASQDSLEQSVLYEKLRLSKLLPSQYLFRIISLIVIADKTNTLNQVDTSMLYCRRALALIEKNGFEHEDMLLNLYENLVYNFESKKKLDSALFYSDKLKYLTFNYLNHLNKNEQENFKFDLDFSLRKQKVEEENKRNKQIIIFTVIILLLLSATIFFISRARRRLSKAYVQIQELQHSREKFYSIIAHDLRSPLDSYQGLANTLSYLLKKNDYDQIEKISQKIDDNGIKIQAMLRNLFQWSLAEQKKLSYMAEAIHTAPFLTEITSLYEDIAESRSLKLLLDLNKEAMVNTDKNYLATIVRNLLDNAIKYAIPNTTVQLNTYTQENNFILQITNSAHNNPEKIKIIKDLFTDTREWQPRENGIGLGLILVRDFARKMKGEIDLNYTENEVSFFLKIPLYNN